MYKSLILAILAYTNFAGADVSKQDLESIIKQLNDKDKLVLEQIQNQIINWPDSVFKEVQAYKSFVINARKKAEEMRNTLSNEAKEAINIEQEYKMKLSPEAIKILNSIEVQN